MIVDVVALGHQAQPSFSLFFSLSIYQSENIRTFLIESRTFIFTAFSLSF